jgi:signal transduction histidine kinase
MIALLLAFPTGRFGDRPARLTVAAGCAVVALLYLPTVLLVDGYPSPSPWSACVHDCPGNAFALTQSEPHVVSSVIEPLREVCAALLFLAAAAILAFRASRASAPLRRTLVPVTAGAILALICHAAFVISRRVDAYAWITETLGFIAVLAIPGLVLGFAIGLLRWRFSALGVLRRLTEGFSGSPRPATVRGLIADSVGDPSLEIAYWSQDPRGWVNDAGLPVTLPLDDPARAVTEVTSRGTTIAALIHDPALTSDSSVRDVTTGVLLMALDNQRLDAELRSSLRKLHESRARILSAVDLERQRIERDLHDGAQQRLVALRVALEVAAERAEADPRSTAELLAGLGDAVEATLDELRSLARGVFPPLLADHGIAEALRTAARTSRLPTTVTARAVGRYSQQIEAAVYFACLEALQNAAKHSGAKSASITLVEDEDLHFEVRDDGCGFEYPQVGGAGIENMRDRIVSLGGHLTIASRPGEGTTVTGTVPVGITHLTPDVEMLFQRATDALDDCFALYRAARDSHGNVVDFTVEHVNDAACRFAGRSRELQVGRTLEHLEPGYRESESFAWHVQALEADGPSSREDVQYEEFAGGRRLVRAYEVRAAPLGGGRLAVTWHEISERRKEQDALHLYEERVRLAVRGAPLVLYAMDLDLRYTWVFNDRVGLRGDERAIGRADEELFGRVVARPLTRLNRRALAGQRARGVVEVNFPEGRYTFDITVEPLRDEDGRVVGLAGASYDITPRGRARLLDELFTMSPVGMGVVAADGRFLEANRSFCRLVGCSAEELKMMALADLRIDGHRLVTFPISARTGMVGVLLEPAGDRGEAEARV